MAKWETRHTNPVENWPQDEQGQPVKAVFLRHVSGTELDVELELSLFRAYGIPVWLQSPNDGDFGRLILGFSGTGTDFYVPETMLEDAMNIMNGDITPEEEFE